MSKELMAEDEATLTEIIIQPDGRVYVFGLSFKVLEILGTLAPTDSRLMGLLNRANSCFVEPALKTKL